MSSFWMFVINDWVFAIPMLAMSVCGIALITWRILLNRGLLQNTEAHLETLKATLLKDGIKAAITLNNDQKDC